MNWDEAANSSVLDEYIHFLRGMFKGSEPTEEIRSELLSAIEEEQWDEFWDFQQKSSAL